MECDCDININKLHLTEADQVSDLFKITLPVETVGESEELHKLNQCTSIIKYCYRRNLPQRDFKDLGKTQEWFEQHEPFNLSEGRLCSYPQV